MGLRRGSPTRHSTIWKLHGADTDHFPSIWPRAATIKMNNSVSAGLDHNRHRHQSVSIGSGNDAKGSTGEFYSNRSTH